MIHFLPRESLRPDALAEGIKRTREEMEVCSRDIYMIFSSNGDFIMQIF